MNGFGAVFLAIGGWLVLTLPRRAAVLPLLASVLWMTGGQVLQIADANFTIPRLLVALGFVRVLLRGEQVAGGLHGVDRLVLLWAAVLFGSSAWHTSDAWMYRAGIVWTEVGCYFLFRILLRDLDDLRRAARAVCLLAVPVAASMLVEKANGQNAFGWLGGVNLHALVRDGHVRASGPFAHPILAGTAGAACIALGLSIRRVAPASAVLGVMAGTAIVFAATSSGPILMVAAILLGRWLWLLRDHMGTVRKGAVVALLALSAAMNDPIYFLMARIDLSGGSQGYFRAQLIRSSIEHLSEWWLCGTDYTRHWMASGVYANARHTDITNHFLAMGVMGGLPLMALLIGIVALSFRDAGRGLRLRAGAAADERRFVWALGALLFGFAMSFWSISLFDQSVIFFWLTVAAIQTAACGAEPQPLAEAAAAAATPAFGSGARPAGSRVGGDAMTAIDDNATVSVIIVSWNAREHLRACLQSVYAAGAPCLREVIVVDNASADGSAELVEREFPQAELVRAGANLGFARANNLAMARAAGSLFALVNSDARLHPRCLETLAGYLQRHPEAGAVGPRVSGADGGLQRSCRHLPGLWNTLCRALALDRLFGARGIFSGHEVPPARHERLHEAEILSGCFFVARRAAVEQVGGLDERFFFYAEDIDWCKRFRDAGWKLVFVPEATATHFGGGSTSRTPLRYSIEILRSTLAYWRKHHGERGRLACHGLLLLHHGARWVLRSLGLALGLSHGAESRHKLREDAACLRWLVFGTEPATT